MDGNVLATEVLMKLTIASLQAGPFVSFLNPCFML